MTEYVLVVKDLKVRFHTEEGIVHAVNGLSYTMKAGETIGIVGESGCGKSVSVLSVMGLLPQPPANITGKVEFQGMNLMDTLASTLRELRGSRLAMIFQDPMTSLNPVLTIGFQMMEPLKVHMKLDQDKARERAIDLLELVGIPQAEDRIDDYPHQFSGGMRQRVMIAMALACNPALLIADEPTTALDVTIQAQIVELVKRLKDQFGMSLIWITHDLGVVAGLVDRVLVMYAGFLVEKAIVDDLYENPKHPYSNALLHSIPSVEGKPGDELASIEGLPPDLLEEPEGCAFAPRCDFVKDYCWNHVPPLLSVEPDHEVACWVDMTTGELRPQAMEMSYE
jgi:oligopeptide transport system ATP-binding protein